MSGHISFKQSGGVAGIRRQWEQPIDGLPISARKGVAALIKHQSNRTPPRARDLLSYEIVLSRGKEKRHYRFDESTLPVGARSLVVYLAARSQSVA